MSHPHTAKRPAPTPSASSSSEGGFFKAELKFPPEFPSMPPDMRFLTPMFHPNSASARPPRVPGGGGVAVERWWRGGGVRAQDKAGLMLQHRRIVGARTQHPCHYRPLMLPPLPPSLPSPPRARAVYPDGRVCISILHNPGIDPFNAQERADERWRPILGVEQVRR